MSKADSIAEPIPNEGFTHSGVFHADDVFAAALLTILNPNIKIIRGREVPKCFNGIAFDIGGGRFDHHFETRRVRANGIPFASFGLIWEAFGEELLPQPEDRSAFDEQFVQPIDLADNTGEPCEMTEAIACFNPTWDSCESTDQRFEIAVQWAAQALTNRIDHFSAQKRADRAVRERMAECDGRVLVLDRYMPWQPAVIGSGYIYVVFPSLHKGYNVQAVPIGPNSRTTVKPFPKEWRGKSASELRIITGVSDILFCHLAGFLCATETLKGALDTARRSMATEHAGQK